MFYDVIAQVRFHIADDTTDGALNQAREMLRRFDETMDIQIVSVESEDSQGEAEDR